VPVSRIPNDSVRPSNVGNAPGSFVSGFYCADTGIAFGPNAWWTKARWLALTLRMRAYIYLNKSTGICRYTRASVRNAAIRPD